MHSSMAAPRGTGAGLVAYAKTASPSSADSVNGGTTRADDPVEQLREDGVGLRDGTIGEGVVSVGQGHGLQERCIAADVDEEE